MLDPISTPRASLQPARRRDHEPPVSAEVAQSLDYQLLRRTLNPDSEIKVSDAPPAASPAPSAARSSGKPNPASAPAVPGNSTPSFGSRKCWYYARNCRRRVWRVFK